MRNPGAERWMRGKAHSTWWCAQRGHLLGVRRLLTMAPHADFFLLSDADTQGELLTNPCPNVTLANAADARKAIVRAHATTKRTRNSIPSRLGVAARAT